MVRTLENVVSDIAEQQAIFNENATKQVEKGNQSAGARARKASLLLTALYKEFRKLSVK